MRTERGKLSRAYVAVSDVWTPGLTLKVKSD